MRACLLEAPVSIRVAVLVLSLAGAAQGQAAAGADASAEAASASEEDAIKANARSLANDASSAYRSGNFVAAYDGFNRAFHLVKVPMLGVWSARSLFELGRFVEASERYQDVLKLELPADAAESDRQAVETARVELEQLLPKIPTLTVTVKNASVDEVQFTLDGKPMPAALVDVAQKLDPGEHVVMGVLGNEKVEGDVFLKEGGASQLELTFKPTVSFEGDGGAGPGSGGNTKKTLGFIGIGVGGAFLVTGAVALGVSLDQQSQLAVACPSGTCPPGQADLVSSFELMKTLTLVGFIGGGALEVLGITLVLTSPKKSGQEISLHTRGAGLALRGTF